MKGVFHLIECKAYDKAEAITRSSASGEKGIMGISHSSNQRLQTQLSYRLKKALTMRNLTRHASHLL